MAEGGHPSRSFSEGNQEHAQETSQDFVSSAAPPSEPSAAPPTEPSTAQPTEPSAAPPTKSFDIYIRDPGADGGKRKAAEVYRRYLKENFPNYKGQVYRVPPLYISPSITRKVPGFDYEVLTSHADHVRGNEAEKLTATCIEYLLRYWVQEKSPAFIITGYDFKKFCNKSKEPKSVCNKYNEKGEHDVVIIHLKYGVIFIQIKSCEEESLLTDRIEKALKQLDKDERFFDANFPDIRPPVDKKQIDKKPVDITDVLALPDTDKVVVAELAKTMLKERYVEDGLDKCLFSDNLPRIDDDEQLKKAKKTRLLDWWKRITDQKKGFASIDDYEKTVAMYVGEKSTVELPGYRSKSGVKPEGRSWSECLSRVSPSIVLTPQQLYVLNTDLKKLVIRGNYGAGKTVLLVLKVRQLLKTKETPICVISMSPAPLKKVLEESITYEIESGADDIKFVTVHNQKSLNGELEQCSKERRHVFIDEFPSYIHGKQEVDLKTTIQNFPTVLYFWCIMSRESDEEMTLGIKNMFAGHEEVVMKTILRCPPSLHHLVPEFGGSNEEWTKISDHQLETPFTPDEEQTLRNHFDSLGNWSDIKVIADLPTSCFFNKLSKWKIPMIRSTDVVNCQAALFDYSEPDTKLFREAARRKQFAWSIYLKIQDNDVREVRQMNAQDKYFKDEFFKFLRGHGFLSEPRRPWSDIVFVDKTETPTLFQKLESLGIPLVTPSSDDLIGSDKVLFTDTKNSEGFDRKHTITFEGNEVITNKKKTKSTEGPRVIHIDHFEHTDHSGHCSSLKDCAKCGEELEKHLGLWFPSISRASSGGPGVSRETTAVQPTDSKGQSQNLIAQEEYPNMKLSLEDDLVILDDRVGEQNAADLFRRIGVPVEDRFDAVELEDEDAFGKVIYAKSRLWKGMERKVVVSIDNGKSRAGIRHFGETREMVKEDGIEVAITRCSAQLICIKT